VRNLLIAHTIARGKRILDSEEHRLGATLELLEKINQIEAEIRILELRLKWMLEARRALIETSTNGSHSEPE
jgi:hypothetical protein